MFRLLMFLVSFGLLVFSLMTMLDYWRYDDVAQDINQLMRGQVSVADIEQRVAQAIADDNPEDARMYLKIARTFGYQVDAAQFATQLTELEQPLRVAQRQVERFAGGFIDGDGDSSAGVAGAVTADFTVIGDVRDLHEQYDLYHQGDEVNELIVTLAGVGIGLTAATLASGGTAAPAKSGVSALKLAGRSGKLTPKLQRMLVKQGRSVFDYKGFFRAARSDSSINGLRRAATGAYNPRAVTALSETTRSVNRIRQSTSLMDTISLLRYVENADDLRRLEKVSAQYGPLTRGIFRLAGRSVIGTVRLLRHATELLVGLLASLLSFFATLMSLRGLFR